MACVYEIASRLYQYAVSRGAKFRENGYQIFSPDMLLDSEPDEIVPFRNRLKAKDPSKTAICFFTDDKLIFPRLDKLETDLEEYKKYMGVCGFDLSPNILTDPFRQNINVIASQLASLYLALNGIKIIPNFRTGGDSTIASLQASPRDAIFAVGTLGCARGLVAHNSLLLLKKLLVSDAKELLVYGTLRPEYRAILEERGVRFRVYQDFQTRSRNKSKEKQYGRES